MYNPINETEDAFPRARGGDPKYMEVIKMRKYFSPRTRG